MFAVYFADLPRLNLCVDLFQLPRLTPADSRAIESALNAAKPPRMPYKSFAERILRITSITRGFCSHSSSVSHLERGFYRQNPPKKNARYHGKLRIFTVASAGCSARDLPAAPASLEVEHRNRPHPRRSCDPSPHTPLSRRALLPAAYPAAHRAR